MANIKYYDVILKPVVTEKSMAAMAEKKYTFLVHPEANKAQIKEAVEKMFDGTKVKSVNTMNLDGKKKRRGMVVGKTAKTKDTNKKAAQNKGKQENNKEKTANNRTENRGRKKKDNSKKPIVRIIPLGGLNEIGKNMTVYECGNDMFIIDCGLAFPDETMLGIDIVIPDFTYVIQNKEKIRGVFITHGHEDHIGGIPYLMKEINAPLYATKLTVGLIKNKLKEHGLSNQVRMTEVKPGDVIKAGCMSVEFIRVNHSIPDACAMAVHTPAGIIVQTGDFKVDYTPIEGGVIDLGRFGELGKEGHHLGREDPPAADNPQKKANNRR